MPRSTARLAVGIRDRRRRRLLQAAGKRSRHNQQHQRACHLRGYQKAAHAVPAPGDAAAALVQNRAQIAARDANRRNCADDQTRTQRRPERKREDPPVEPEINVHGQFGPDPDGTNHRASPGTEQNPAMPPSTASRMLSVSNWRMSRLRPAPSAARMAISRSRIVERTSRMLATFMHASTRTIMASPRNNVEIRNIGFCGSGLGLELISGYELMAMSFSTLGYSCENRWEITPSEEFASRLSIPGFSRARRLMFDTRDWS